MSMHKLIFKAVNVISEVYGVADNIVSDDTGVMMSATLILQYFRSRLQLSQYKIKNIFCQVQF